MNKHLLDECMAVWYNAVLHADEHAGEYGGELGYEGYADELCEQGYADLKYGGINKADARRARYGKRD